MNREQAIVVLKILKTAYPRFYANMTRDEAENTLSLWVDMFKGDNPELVLIAVKKLIGELEFPPTIADVKKSIYSITDQTESNIELWNKFLKAVSNSGYNSASEYELLPCIVKKFVGNRRQLREYAMMDSSTINSVIKGQFLKHIEILKEREKEQKMMLPEVREIVQALTNKIDNHLLEGK